MIQSMTAFTRHEIKYSWGYGFLEIRSLNQRYLEINLRLPEYFRHLDQEIRNIFRDHLSRGKIDCYLQFEIITSNKNILNINKELLFCIIQKIKWVNMQFDSNKTKINPIDILRWPGVTVNEEAKISSADTELLNIVNITINDLIKVRETEGVALKKIIEKQLTNLKNEIRELKNKLPVIKKMQQERFLIKLQSFKEQTESNKLEQEIILFFQRFDITEELDRLDIHVKNIYHMLNKQEPIGRRLDFMMQELFRETNTLASKAINIDIINSAIEIKVFIEQMREQIQNVE
ncbi:MAG: YicC/YloC family endoribonuclease [Candidatus Dasytiphilus stammeri]